MSLVDPTEQRLVASIPSLTGTSDLSSPSVRAALCMQESLGIERELEGPRRGRAFFYARYLALLEEEAQSFGTHRYHDFEVWRPVGRRECRGG